MRALTPIFVLCCSLAAALALFPPRAIKPVPTIGALRFNDMMGTAHVLAHPPKRVVFAANIMPPFATLAGNFNAVAGAMDLPLKGMESGFLNRIFAGLGLIAQAGSNNAYPNVEQILRLTPDTVFAWPQQTAALVNVPSFDVITFSTSVPLLESHITLWRLLGNLTEESTKAGTLFNVYRERLQIIAKGVAALSTHPTRALILISGSSSLRIGSKYHSLTEQLEFAGAENVAAGGVGNSFSLEDVARTDPDVILISTFFENLVPQDLFNDSAWQMIKAVRQRQVYVVPSFPLFTAPVFDPLLVQWLVDTLHPEVRTSELRAAIKRTYAEVYNYALSNSDVDMLLAMTANKKSRGYERFQSQ